MQTVNSISIAGLNKPGVEIHKSGKRLEAFYKGRQIGFWQLPRQIIEEFKAKMGRVAKKSEIECFVAGNWGKLDEVPDRDEHGNISAPEYTGGVVYFDNGQEVSPCEKLVLQLIELMPFEIADKLCISTNTVNNHIKSLLRKSGLPDAKSLAVFAVRIKLI